MLLSECFYVNVLSKYLIILLAYTSSIISYYLLLLIYSTELGDVLVGTFQLGGLCIEQTLASAQFQSPIGLYRALYSKVFIISNKLKYKAEPIPKFALVTCCTVLAGLQSY